MKERIKLRSRTNLSLTTGSEKFIYIEDALVVMVLGYAAAFWFVAYLGLTIASLPGTTPGEHMLYWLAYLAQQVSSTAFVDHTATYRAYMLTLRDAGTFHHLAFPFIAAFFAGFYGAYLGAKYLVRPVGGLIHTRGSKLFEGHEGFDELKRVADEECTANPLPAPTYAIAVRGGENILSVKDPRNAIWIANARKVTHSLVFGATRSGKSQYLKRVAVQLINSGGKMVFLDKKGEYTQMLDTSRCIILGLHDARQFRWDLAKDLLIAEDVLTFMEGQIPVSDKDPFWGNATRAICSGLLISLVKTRPRKWTLSDFTQLCNLTQEQMIPIIEAHYPPALQIIKMEGQTIANVIGNIAAYTTSLKAFGEIWSQCDYPSFSVIEWLEDPAPERRTIILKSSGKFSTINDPMIRSVLTLMGKQIDSDGFPDDTPEKPRNLNFICDEFQSFGKLDSFITGILERGASKGVSVLLACQDIAQLQQVYSEQFVKFLTSNSGNIIVTGSQKGDTAQYLSNMVGDYSFEKLHVSTTAQVDSSNKTINFQEHQAKVITPDEVSSKLGARNGEIRFLYLGARFDDAYIIHQPIIKFPNVSPALVPASWVTGDVPASKAPSSSQLMDVHNDGAAGNARTPDLTASPTRLEDPIEIEPDLDLPQSIDAQATALRHEQAQKVYDLTEGEPIITPQTFAAPLVSKALGAQGAEHLLDLVEGLTAPKHKQTTSKAKFTERLQEQMSK